jgi:hypothetical protein
MNSRTGRLTGFAIALSASAVALAGCGPDSDTPAATPGSATASVSVATPRDALLKAVPDDQAGAYHFTVKGGTQPVTGVMDSARKAATIEVSQSEPDAGFRLDMKFLMIEKQSWTKISFTPATLPGLPKLPKKWMLIDPSKIKDKDSSPLAYEGEIDPGSTAGVFQSSADVHEVSPGHFAGTTDLSQQTDAGIVDDATLKALGAKAKAVPFQAVVDGQGHLTSTTVKIPAAGKVKASTYAVIYDGFGSTETPAVPAAGQQQKAPATVYEMLNG